LFLCIIDILFLQGTYTARPFMVSTNKIFPIFDGVYRMDLKISQNQNPFDLHQWYCEIRHYVVEL
jgi:hypothetical protein